MVEFGLESAHFAVFVAAPHRDSACYLGCAYCIPFAWEWSGLRGDYRHVSWMRDCNSGLG